MEPFSKTSPAEASDIVRAVMRGMTLQEYKAVEAMKGLSANARVYYRGKKYSMRDFLEKATAPNGKQTEV